MLKSSKFKKRFKKNSNSQELNNKAPVIASNMQVEPEKLVAANNDKDIENSLQIALLNKIESIPVWFEYTDLKQRELIRNFVDNQLNLKQISMDEDGREDLTAKLHDAVSGFGQLDYFLSRDNVSAIFVTGTQNIYIEIDGKVLNTEISLSENQINLIINNIFKSCNVKLDSDRKIWNLKDENYCISIIMPPICESGINITVRKIVSCDVQSFFEKNVTSKEIFDFIITVLNENKNIVISGDINSGKTFLLNVIINALKTLKHSVLIEKYPQILADNGDLIKFLMPDKSVEVDSLLSNVLRLSPEFIFADINKPLCEISEKKGSISTLRASSVDGALTKLIASFMAEQNLPEKYAKLKALNDYDYIVQLNKIGDGSLKVTSVVELKPAKTLPLSVKVIAKLVDGQYITEIPQPLTSIRAESIISPEGPMYSRFYPQN